MAGLIPAKADHTEALRTFLADATSLPVGDGKAPAGAGWQGAPGQSSFVAYLVVHSTPGGALAGSLGRPSTEAQWLWQIDSVGATQHATEKALDRVRDHLLAVPLPDLAIPGRKVTYVDEEISSGSAREDPDQPATFRSFAQYRIWTTPRSL